MMMPKQTPENTALIVWDAHVRTLFAADLLCHVCEDVPWTQRARWCDALICANCAEGEPEPECCGFCRSPTEGNICSDCRREWQASA